MQRNLDEVLRAVPMDLSDNMEQISGSKPRTSVQRESIKPSPPPVIPPSLTGSTHPPNLIPTPTSEGVDTQRTSAATSSNGEGNHFTTEIKPRKTAYNKSLNL